MSMDLEKLETEQHNPSSDNLENMDIASITATINREDQKVAIAVQKALPQINRAIELAVFQLKQGGRLIYIGAGTSGRLGILDASECPPTYGVSPDLVQGIIAGGRQAIIAAQEGAEDNEEAAQVDLKAVHLSKNDMVIGLAASGRTPYVVAGLTYAKEIGAKIASIACVSEAAVSQVADVGIEVLVGAEVITGSSRMKAGTAQKLVLNMISTTCMIQLGKVYKGYMVDVQPTNQKLIERAKRIIMATTEANYEEAATVFEAAGKNVKVAIIMQLTHFSKEEAETILQQHEQNVAYVIDYSKKYKGEL